MGFDWKIDPKLFGFYEFYTNNSNLKLKQITIYEIVNFRDSIFLCPLIAHYNSTHFLKQTTIK